MKKLLTLFIQKTAKLAPFWWLYKLCRRLSWSLLSVYQIGSAARDGYSIDSQAFVKQSFPDLVVKNGPFQGMRYPSANSAGSALLPKLLGSYEAELNGLLAQIVNADYAEILDIGCAEGYYAVGLAMKCPNVRVHAYDVNPKARAMCESMAKLNGTLDRLVLGGWCDESTLINFPFRGRALIISDCEGYEKQLFTPKVAKALINHDILIEVHDLIDFTISSSLRKAFEATHDILVIQSVDDVKKVNTYSFKELEGYSLRERWWIMRETRGAQMEWFFVTPKKEQHPSATA